MTQYSENQQNLEQQQPPNHLLQCQRAVGQSEKYICTTAANPTSPTQLDPATFLHYVSSIAAIIQGITLLVVALTKFSKVLVPVMLQKPDEKTKPQFPNNGCSKR